MVEKNDYDGSFTFTTSLSHSANFQHPINSPDGENVLNSTELHQDKGHKPKLNKSIHQLPMRRIR